MANDPVRAMCVSPGGAITEVTLPVDVQDQLDAMHRQIGCSLVEPVDLGDELTMWCDEEGFLVPEPQVNLCATGVAASHGRLEQPYVGTVVFTGATPPAGDLQGLTAQQAADLRRECEGVVRVVAMHRISYPGRTVIDDVRLAQCEGVEAGIGAR